MDADFLLIHKMKNGDETAMEIFVTKYYPAIRNYCRSHTWTDDDAEDLAQATFERFFHTFTSYHHCGKLANYLYVIAGNLCRDKLPDELREVIILYSFQELKLKEVAEIVNIGLPLVKYRIKKAKELLRIYLGEED